MTIEAGLQICVGFVPLVGQMLGLPLDKICWWAELP